MNLNELSNAFVSPSTGVKQTKPNDNSDKNKDQSFSLLLSQLLDNNGRYKYSAPSASASNISSTSLATQAVDAVSAAASSSGVNISV